MKSERRLTEVGDEILYVLRMCGPMGILGLEDRCATWHTPEELREALAEAVRTRRVKKIGLLPSGAVVSSETPGAYQVYVA